VTVDLFAGIPVSDLNAALDWYARLFGSPPSFRPNDREAVWELGEHRYVFIEYRPEHVGHARHLLFVDDLEARVAKIAERGLSAPQREAYPNGVTKATYCDPDGNLFEFGGTAPAGPQTHK
jgi:catechol 2,3-dioxygenase-like lactoylglutathione lyase family enzyme